MCTRMCFCSHFINSYFFPSLSHTFDLLVYIFRAFTVMCLIFSGRAMARAYAKFKLSLCSTPNFKKRKVEEEKKSTENVYPS